MIRLHNAAPIAGAALALTLMTGASNARAASCQAEGSAMGRLLAPQAAYLVSALPALAQSKLASASLATGAASAVTAAAQGTGGCQRPSFVVGGATFFITGSDANTVLPRVALTSGGSGPVAVLAQAPVLKGGDVPAPLEPTSPDQIYVLATVSGSQVAVWALYDGLPDDRILAQAMQSALKGGERPMLRFDPLFKGDGLTGAAKYVLPSN